MRNFHTLFLCCFALSIATSHSAAQATAPQGDTPSPAATAPAASQPAAVTQPATTAAPNLRFAQITDAHLFDAGYRCSGTYVDREYQENLHALEWSIAQINSRWAAGDKISFLVFTGDLGITNLAVDGVEAPHPAPGEESACVDDDSPNKLVGPITQPTFESAAAQLGHVLDSLPTGVTVYFLPGNNDLDDEDPASMPKRYTLFVNDLIKATHHKVVDLIRGPATAGGFTLLGLNSAGFKPQNYDLSGTSDPAVTGKCGGEHCDEPDQAIPGTTIAISGKKTSDGSGPLMYCTDLLAAGSGPRAAAKTDAINAVVNQLSTGPYLVFTHEPDLQDAHRSENTKKGCEYRSTWLLTDAARTTWQTRILNNQDVIGIFAGHFHSSDFASYGGPKFDDALIAGTSTLPLYTAPTFVAMPLAIKLQWPGYPLSARGMAFYTVRGRIVSPEIEIFPAAAYASGSTTHTKAVAEALLELHTYPGFAFLLALLLTLILIAIILWMASSLDPKCDPPLPSHNPFQRLWHWIKATVSCCLNQVGKLIYEGDTQSYSLSRLQFLLWTVATVYGYTYLYIAHTWVQGLPGLPDVAGSFPWETLLAGGTAVATLVSKQVVGSKGGGPLKPHISDLISAGGVVATGRIQFLSWTLVAITAYISSILASDPTTIHLLPEIPTRLLEISGISAGAYLAARGVSTGGPTLTSAILRIPKKLLPDPSQTAPPDPNAPEVIGELLIIGNYLSKSATLHAFQPTHVATEAQKLLTATAGDGTPSPDAPPEQTGLVSDAVSGIDGVPIEGFKYLPPPFDVQGSTAVSGTTDLYPRLLVKLICDPHGPKWAPPAKWTLRVENPDGKYAEVQVAMDAPPPEAPNAEPAIDPVNPARITTPLPADQSIPPDPAAPPPEPAAPTAQDQPPS